MSGSYHDKAPAYFIQCISQTSSALHSTQHLRWLPWKLSHHLDYSHSPLPHHHHAPSFSTSLEFVRSPCKCCLFKKTSSDHPFQINLSYTFDSAKIPHFSHSTNCNLQFIDILNVYFNWYINYMYLYYTIISIWYQKYIIYVSCNVFRIYIGIDHHLIFLYSENIPQVLF